MVFLSLAVEAAENVGRQAAVGNNTADGCHAFQVPLTVVLTVHQFQDTAASALHGQVDVAAHVGLFGNDVQRLVAHVLGVRGGEADAHAGRGLCHGAQQLREVDHRAVGPLEAVGVDVLPQQGDFLVAACLEVGHLAQDALHVAAALAATGIGHDAVGAEVIAPAHDGHEARNVVAAHARRHHVAIGLGGRQFHIDGLLPGFGGGNEVGQGEVGVGTCHQVHAVVGDEVVLHALGHTAHHAHQQVRTLLLERLEKVEAVEYLLLGVVADGAGIHKHGVGLVERRGRAVARHLHDGGNDFTVGHVHLAAVGFDEQLLVVTGSCRFKVCFCFFLHKCIYVKFKLRTRRAALQRYTFRRNFRAEGPKRYQSARETEAPREGVPRPNATIRLPSFGGNGGAQRTGWWDAYHYVYQVLISFSTTFLHRVLPLPDGGGFRILLS